LNIALVLGGAEDGGLEKHVIELASELKNRHIDVSVIAHKKFKQDFSTVNFIPLDLSKGRNNPIILFKLYSILKKGKFDIIHTQANKATDMVIKLKPFLNSKIISTLHSYKKNIKSYEKADFVITVSDKIGEKLKNPNKITIYNGIKQEEIEAIDLHEKFNIPKDKFIICSVGRLVEVKRFDVLIKSIALLDDVHLVLVGDGPKKEELEKLVEKLNIEKDVTFTGMLNTKETKEMIKSSHLAVITSQREGFSYFFAESLVLNTPLISTDVADIQKFITNKYMIPFGKYKQLSIKIEYIRSNYAIILDDFKSSFKSANDEFTISKMISKTISCYRRILI
jgi:glycosyltransferase involved in cell wall biosynthesis